MARKIPERTEARVRNWEGCVLEGEGVSLATIAKVERNGSVATTRK
jgi:hypothetical protein